jgi:predicted ATP-grasp superfamily ATP-dependent carboligase
VLFPLQDEVVELVARNAESLAKGYRLVTQPWEILRWAHDKRLAYQVAGDVGIETPKTWYPQSETEIPDMGITFPAIIKPTNSVRLQYATGRKALPARELSELREQYRTAATVLASDEIMVQEVIPGDGRTQFSVAAYCKEGRLLLGMTARRRRQYPIDYGLSSSLVEAIEVPGLIEVAARLLARLRLSGMVEVEFKQDPRDGRLKLLDVNIRPWGWHTLCRACGLDFPYVQYADALGEPVVATVPRYGARWRRLITDIPAGVQEVRAGVTSPGACLKSFIGRSVPSVFDVRDPLPALGDLAIVVARSMKRGRGRAVIPPSEGAPTLPSPRGGGEIHEEGIATDVVSRSA